MTASIVSDKKINAVHLRIYKEKKAGVEYYTHSNYFSNKSGTRRVRARIRAIEVSLCSGFISLLVGAMATGGAILPVMPFIVGFTSLGLLPLLKVEGGLWRARRALSKFERDPVPHVVEAIRGERARWARRLAADAAASQKSIENRERIRLALGREATAPITLENKSASLDFLKSSLDGLRGHARTEFLEAAIHVIGPAIKDAEKEALYAARAKMLSATAHAEAAQAHLSEVERKAAESRRYVETALLPNRDSLLSPI